MIDLQHYIEKTRKRIDARLEETTPPELYAITKDGKKLRSVLCCLVYDTLTDFKSSPAMRARALDLACSVEVVHNVTLAADDIIDQDDMRRGKPSLHALKGFSIAFLEVLSGISFPYQMVAPYGVEYINAVSQVQQDMCYGVLKEITKDLPATRIYEIVIDKKTGVLFSLAARFGAMAADASEEEVEMMSKFGLHLGRAYQIADDIEDFINVVSHKKTPDAITGTEFILLRGLKVDEILKEWGLDIVKGKPELAKVSQTKQLFQLYELLATLNRRLDIELRRATDIISDYDERDTLQKYLRVCIPY
jgi:geranylgeranyl pyrophosphate synthase